MRTLKYLSPPGTERGEGGHVRRVDGVDVPVPGVVAPLYNGQQKRSGS